MASRMQVAILRDETGGDNRPIKRWRLYAHGAPYTREEAAPLVAHYGKANVRLLVLPRGQ